MPRRLTRLALLIVAGLIALTPVVALADGSGTLREQEVPRKGESGALSGMTQAYFR